MFLMIRQGVFFHSSRRVFCSCAAKGFIALLSLKPRGLFISFARTKETKQRRVVEDSVRKKFAVCTFLPTPVLFCAKQKELAVAQTAFCF